MKFCPVCQTKYDEEILRFCIKDGAPLIDEDQPNFKEMPSEEDLGEDTVISRKPTQDELDALKKTDEPEPARIVIPTAEQERGQQVRARNYQQPPPPPKSTAMVVLTTVVLTLVGLTALAGLVYFFKNGGDESNSNVNINTNLPNSMNLNTGFGINSLPSNFDYNSNFNSNFNTNLNSNFNTNFNTRTPTPTKTPAPTPSPSPSVSPSPVSTANMSTPTPVRTPTPDTPKTPTVNPTKTPSAGGTPTN